MVHLGITIAKEVNATLKSLELEDNASFKCILPDGQSIAMSSTDHDLAFYQKSYYEKRYTAILIDEFVKERYYNDLKGFTDVSKKPVIFDFKSNEIEKELLPLYNSSTTWKEFFDKINDKYDNKKCTVISVWLKTALRYIMNNNIYSGLDWKIDITKIPTIRYEERVLLKTGGRRTLKHKKYVDEPMLPEILDMDWKTYFKQFRVEGV
jgi:hypothetical protein